MNAQVKNAQVKFDDMLKNIAENRCDDVLDLFYEELDIVQIKSLLDVLKDNTSIKILSIPEPLYGFGLDVWDKIRDLFRAKKYDELWVGGKLVKEGFNPFSPICNQVG